MYCRIAHARIYSGTSNAQRNKGSWYVRRSTSHFRSLSRRAIPGSSGVDDIFGWSEPQVQRNIVDRQLQTMFHNVRVWRRSPLPEGSRVSIDDIGIASPKAFWVIAYKRSRTNMTSSLSWEEEEKSSRRCAPFIKETLFSFTIPFVAWRLSNRDPTATCHPNCQHGIPYRIQVHTHRNEERSRSAPAHIRIWHEPP
jgi:hypothetical protein